MVATINADTTNGVVITSDTSGEIALQANGVTKAKVTANGLQDANGASLRGGSFRNLVINGDMRIDQRNAGSAITSHAGFAVDRYKLLTTAGGSVSLQQSTDAPEDASYSLKFTVVTGATPSSGVTGITQSIEGNNVAHLKLGTANAKTVTLSFWVKASVTGTYSMSLMNGAVNRFYIHEYTINAANTWEKKTVTLTGDTTGTWATNNTTGFRIDWNLGSDAAYYSSTLDTWFGGSYTIGSTNDNNLLTNTGATWQVSLVQLEVGSGASDFEFLPYDVQLARCQRYFSTSYGNNPVGTNTWDGTVAGRNYDTSSRSENVVNIHYPVQMRALPTLTAYSKAGTSGKLVAGSTSVDVSTTEIACSLKGSATIIRAVTGAAVGGTHWYQFHYTASAEL